MGDSSVLIYVIDHNQNIIQKFEPAINEKEFKISGYTCCSFSQQPGIVYVGTREGDMIVFDDRSLNNLAVILPKGQKSAIKSLK